MSISLHFTEEDWARSRQNWTLWWAGELDRPLVMIEGVDASPDHELPEVPSFVSSFPLDMPALDVIARYQAHLEARRFYGDAWPRWFVNFGPGMLAGFLGARVNSVPETVWFDPADVLAIEDIHPRYDAENVWWRRVRGLTQAAVEAWGGQVSVSIADLGGNLDVLASLRTTETLLTDLYDAPDEVVRLAGEITDLWLRYYDDLYAIIEPAGSGTTPWAPIWSPGRCYMLQSDFAYMISPAMFERFVLPDLVACCGALDHGFYHLDGKGEIVHLDMLLSLERLRGIQWIPGDGQPPPDQWPELLKRIKDGGKRCQVFVSPEGARTIVRELGGRGFALSINERMTEAEAGDFLYLLKLDDADRSKP